MWWDGVKASPIACLKLHTVFVSVKQKRAHRYRFYPTPTQTEILARTFGCVRYVYNWALNLRKEAYYERQEHLGYRETSAALTVIKHEPNTAWLNEVSSVPLQQALRHLDNAYQSFFEGRTQYPSFHKKRGRQSATYASNAFHWEAERRSLTLAKMERPP